MSTAQTSTDPLDRSRFPADPWRLVECDPDRTDLGVTETLFTVANGYIGMRGNPEEGRHAHEHGTYINGFHETWPIRHAEAAYGFARPGQTLVHPPPAPPTNPAMTTIASTIMMIWLMPSISDGSDIGSSTFRSICA